MTGSRCKKKHATLLPFRVRKWFAPVDLPEYAIPLRLAQYLLSTTSTLVASVLLDELDAPVVHGEGFWYFPDKTDQARPLLVAHVDTVCTPSPPTNLALADELLYSPGSILGADDRAGVYAAYMIRQRTGVGMLLCDEEERGAHGARAAARTIGGLIQGHPYMIELDRQGHRQVVYYRDECPAFMQHMESYGFSKNYGSFSDISVLSRELDVPGANVSVGFHYQHSKLECLDLRSLDDVITRVSTLVEENRIVAFTPVVDRWRTQLYDWQKPVKKLEPVVDEHDDLVDLIEGATAAEIEEFIDTTAVDLTPSQIDELTALQIERLEEERQAALDDMELRQQEDNMDSLYAWWNCG